MTFLRTVAVTVVVCLLSSSVAGAVPPPASLAAPPSPAMEPTPPDAHARASYGELSLAFEENQGQADPAVKFLARGAGYTTFLTATETVLVLNRPAQRRAPALGDRLAATPAAAAQPTAVIRMSLAGANPAPRLLGQRPLPGVVNYFVGRDPSRWRTNVPTYASVAVEDVYPGIGMVYYGQGRQLEYDFLVAPGADPGRVRLVFAGVDSLRVDAGGDLVLAAAGRELRMRQPVTYQTIAGIRRTIASRYTIVPATTPAARPQVAFAVGAYDHAHPLVIDPVVVYTAVLGGTQSDSINGLAADAAGNAYLVGKTSSAEFPVVGGVQPHLGGAPGVDSDVFVAKLNPGGTALLYSTYLGGAAIDAGLGIAVDAAGNAYVTGETASIDFPVTLGALQTGLAGRQNAFVVKLNPAGSTLVYATYLGGRHFDSGAAIAVNAAGNAHVVGYTGSEDFPVTGVPAPAFGVISGFYDAFVAKLLPDGSGLVYATFLGGIFFDRATGVALDSQGSAWVVGVTGSPDFPLLRPIQDNIAVDTEAAAAFIVQLDPAGLLRYSTYLSGTVSGTGGSYETQATAVAVDRAGNVHVTGSTRDADFPTLNAFQTALGAAAAVNAFVAKLNASGELLYSTYLGGRGTDLAQQIAIGPSGSAWVVGGTDSPDFPKTVPATLTEAYGFVSRISPTGALLLSMPVRARPATSQAPNSVFLRAVALDPSGRVYFGGEARGLYQPEPTGPLPQPQNFNVENAVLTALLPFPDLLTTAVSVTASSAPPGGKVTTTFTIQNQGETRAPATTARIYLRLGMQRAFVGQVPVGALTPFQSLSSTISFMVPKTTAAGFATVEVCGNDPIAVVEEGSTNNCRNSAALRIVRPDLIVSDVTPQAPEILAGTSVLVQTTTVNQGDALAPPSTLRYYFATSPSHYSNDVRSSTQVAVGALGPGVNVVHRPSVAVPLTLPPGNYWIIACADDLGVDPEGNEGNNCRAATAAVRVLPVALPDVWVSSIGASGPAVIGQPTRVGVVVFNIGTGPAPASILRFYFSRFRHRSAADVRSLTVASVPALGVGQANFQESMVAVPGTLTPGGYYIMVCADDLGVVPEINENNCTDSSLIQVTTPGAVVGLALPQVSPSIPRSPHVGAGVAAAPSPVPPTALSTPRTIYMAPERFGLDDGRLPMAGVLVPVAPLAADGDQLGTLDGDEPIALEEYSDMSDGAGPIY